MSPTISAPEKYEISWISSLPWNRGAFIATNYNPNWSLFTTIVVNASLEKSFATIISGFLVILQNSNKLTSSFSV